MTFQMTKTCCFLYIKKNSCEKYDLTRPDLQPDWFEPIFNPLKMTCFWLAICLTSNPIDPTRPDPTLPFYHVYQFNLPHLMAKWPLNSVFTTCNLLYLHLQGIDGTRILARICSGPSARLGCNPNNHIKEGISPKRVDR